VSRKLYEPVLLAACQDTELAWEENGHGVFTSALLRELKKGKHLQCSDLIKAVGSLLLDQKPRFAGRDRVLFFRASAEQERIHPFVLKPKNLLPPRDMTWRGEVSASRLDSQQTRVNHGIAYFAAIDAQEHLKVHQADIFRSMGSPDTPIVGLAGFNEGLMQLANGSLLQEIHIVPSKVLALQEAELNAVGRACSPFPSMIFMPSGETFRPPVYSADGKLLDFEDVVKSFAFQPRFDVALREGKTLATHESTDQENQSPHDNTETRQNQDNESGPSSMGSGSHGTRSIPGSWPTRRNSGEESQPDEEGSSDDEVMVPIPRTTATGQDETPPIAQGREHMQVPQGPPVPGDDHMNQQPHKIHFDIKASIYQPSPGSGLLQELKLIGDFNFQVCIWLWRSFLLMTADFVGLHRSLQDILPVWTLQRCGAKLIARQTPLTGIHKHA
jgi:hypothetical protein